MSIQLMKVMGAKKKTFISGDRLPLSVKARLAWLGSVFFLSLVHFGTYLLLVTSIQSQVYFLADFRQKELLSTWTQLGLSPC